MTNRMKQVKELGLCVLTTIVHIHVATGATLQTIKHELSIYFKVFIFKTNIYS